MKKHNVRTESHTVDQIVFLAQLEQIVMFLMSYRSKVLLTSQLKLLIFFKLCIKINNLFKQNILDWLCIGQLFVLMFIKK